MRLTGFVVTDRLFYFLVSLTLSSKSIFSQVSILHLQVREEMVTVVGKRFEWLNYFPFFSSSPAVCRYLLQWVSEHLSWKCNWDKICWSKLNGKTSVGLWFKTNNEKRKSVSLTGVYSAATCIHLCTQNYPHLTLH